MDTGIVVAFAGTRIPPGWEFCDGRSVSKDDPKYKKLFEAIGAIHGGDANPNFQLPDYRGRFLRGVDGTAGRDPGANLPPSDPAGRQAPGQNNSGNPGNQVGSVQEDMFEAHVHSTNGKFLEGSGGGGFEGAGFESNSRQNHPWARAYTTNSTGGAETRPKNVYVHYIIKL